jgi:hypothetical protein
MAHPVDGLPTIGTAIDADNIVAALCLACNRSREIDLPQIAQDGHADTPLIRLPLVCRDCGSREVKVLVAGRAYR